MVDADAGLEHGKRAGQLREPPVLLLENVHRVPEDALHDRLLLRRVEVERRHLQRQRLALLLAEAEDYDLPGGSTRQQWGNPCECLMIMACRVEAHVSTWGPPCERLMIVACRMALVRKGGLPVTADGYGLPVHEKET